MRTQHQWPELPRDGQDEHEQQSGQFAEEFGDAAVEFVHLHDLGHIVVDDSFVEAEADGRE